MIDLIHKICAHLGCSKLPSFDVEGTRKREFCAGHAKRGMVDVSSKKCAHLGCSKGLSFGGAGTKRA